MAHMGLKPQGSFVNSYPVQILLLLLPLLTIAGVGVLAFHAVKHVDTLTFKDDYSKPQSYLTSTQLDTCLAGLKASPAGQVSVDAIKACEKTAGAAPSIDDLIKTRIDELKWILTMIGSIGALFVIVQSAAAFFSALLYTRQAEKALEDIGKIQDEIKARYPVFASIEEQREWALRDLAQDVKTSSRADNPDANPTEVLDYEYKNVLYATMDIKKRQRILSLESFASIDLHPGPLGAEDYSNNLRRFAIFYQSKFQYEKRAGFGSLSDLERAEGYLRLAIEKSKSDFTLQNDLGVVCLDMLKAMKNGDDSPSLSPDYWKAAAEAFEQSLRNEPHQIRAHYNLAVLAAVYGMPNENESKEEAKKRHYLAAIARLDQALAPHQNNWQRAAAPNIVKSLVRYNRACYRAWLLGVDATKPILTEGDAKGLLDDLNETVKLGGIAAKVKLVETDFNPPVGEEGDIAGAYAKSDTELKSLLDQIKQALLASPSPSEARPLSIRKAIQVIWITYKTSRKKL
jgi:tetratricopeptide (TPR) repeat protein